jgi:hypothetical protein
VKEMVPEEVYNLMIKMLLVDDLVQLLIEKRHVWPTVTPEPATTAAMTSTVPCCETEVQVPPMDDVCAAGESYMSSAPHTENQAMFTLNKFRPKILRRRSSTVASSTAPDKTTVSTPPTAAAITTVLPPPTPVPFPVAVRDAVIDFFLGPSSYISRLLFAHLGGEDVLATPDDDGALGSFRRRNTDLEKTAEELVEGLFWSYCDKPNTEECTPMPYFVEGYFFKVIQEIVTSRMTNSFSSQLSNTGEKRPREADENSNAAVGMRPCRCSQTVRELYCAAVVSLCLHVSVQPLLEYHRGPHALLLTTTPAQTNDLHELMAPLATLFNIVVHNINIGYPVLEESRRADVIIGTPLGICRQVLPRTNDCKGADMPGRVGTDSNPGHKGSVEPISVVFSDISRDPSVMLGPSVAPQELRPSTMSIVHPFEAYYTLEDISQLVSFIGSENVHPVDVPHFTDSHSSKTKNSSSERVVCIPNVLDTEMESEALLRLFATTNQPSLGSSEIEGIKKSNNLAAATAVVYNYSGMHSGILPNCQFLTIASHPASRDHCHLELQHYAKRECAALMQKRPVFMSYKCPSSSKRVLFTPNLSSRAPQDCVMMQRHFSHESTAGIGRNCGGSSGGAHLELSNAVDCSSPETTLSRIQKDMLDEIQELSKLRIQPLWQKVLDRYTRETIRKEMLEGRKSLANVVPFSIVVDKIELLDEDADPHMEVKGFHGGKGRAIKVTFRREDGQKPKEDVENELKNCFWRKVMQRIVVPHFMGGISVDGIHRVHPRICDVRHVAANKRFRRSAYGTHIAIPRKTVKQLGVQIFPPSAASPNGIALNDGLPILPRGNVRVIVSGFQHVSLATTKSSVTASLRHQPTSPKSLSQLNDTLVDSVLRKKQLTTSSYQGDRQLTTCLLQELLEYIYLQSKGAAVTGYTLGWVVQPAEVTPQQQHEDSASFTQIIDQVFKEHDDPTQLLWPSPLKPPPSSTLRDVRDDDGSNDGDDGSELLSSTSLHSEDVDDGECMIGTRNHDTHQSLLHVFPVLFVDLSSVDGAYNVVKALDGMPTPALQQEAMSGGEAGSSSRGPSLFSAKLMMMDEPRMAPPPAATSNGDGNGDNQPLASGSGNPDLMDTSPTVLETLRVLEREFHLSAVNEELEYNILYAINSNK